MNIGKFFNDKQLDDLVTRIDTIVDQLPITPMSSDPDIAVGEVLKQTMTSLENNENQSEVDQLLSSLCISQNRLKRYKIYDEIYSSVQLIKRIIKVYVNNILLCDAVNVKSITIKEASNITETSEIETKNYRKCAQSIIDNFKLERQLRNVVVNDILRYGDHFIEIIDLQDDIVNLPSPDRSLSSKSKSKFVSETFDYIEKRLTTNNTSVDTVVDDCLEKCVDCLVDFDDHIYLTEDEVATVQKDTSGEDFEENPNLLPFERILLRYHKPHNIVVLDTTYGSVLGYVEVSQSEQSNSTLGVGAQFANMISHISSLYRKQKIETNAILQKLVSKIIQKLVNNLDIQKESSSSDSTILQVNKRYESQLQEKLGKSLFYMIKKMYVEVTPPNQVNLKKLSVRFIHTNRMEAFCMTPIEYAPYGTSVIDALVYPAKLYLLTQLTNVVIKLSRAALIRKWILEVGPREHHSQLIQKLIRELRNQKITVEDMLSFKNIPRVLSDFKDMIILSKGGRRFLDSEVSQTGDPNVKIEDLIECRNNIIALSGVPAPYLGFSEVVELREHLVNVNVTFANEIISMQTILNTGLNSLCDKITSTLGLKKKFSDYMVLSLRPPIILLLQMLESTVSSIGNVQQIFQSANIPLDPFYFLKQYLPSLDWVDFQEKAKEYQLRQKGKSPSDQQDQGAGGF